MRLEGPAGCAHEVCPDAAGGVAADGDLSSRWVPSGPGGGLLRERTQVKASTATTAITAITATWIHPPESQAETRSMARSISPDTSTAILRESIPAKTSTATTALTARPIH